ncbi:hypothetical protein L5515_018997 [Caenorhabditis briggsae]|uniref:F-box domain-containing protein n=1 Tax=Caenorhabditis briggsae TaxID=6238 RepID=A0AAE9FNF9_CAEBR|nr:hypothetical protein L5515_018997 [Caenorhabditis briggsae]
MSKNAQENGKIKRIKEAVKEEKDAIQKFPMLKLPDLVRETVIRLMDPVEIFDFSQISKRMHRTAKRSVRHNTYHLHLQAGQLYQAALYPPTYPEVPAEPARFRVQQLDDDTARAPTNNGIKFSYISGDSVSNENMVDLMQTYQCSHTLRFYGRLNEFEIDPLPLKATDLRIDHSHWMTVENVL